ncbi:LacI family DNA-binding transcriptional regulator [Bacillaceae bacterium C204]|uniref:LacI family DNA-binding transcriptional regulator n=1 Tax=Neobacillus sp. 204 TaxID=3383351 RepID=UPI003977E937
MTVTIYDVAEKAGVSIATVSRVINEHPSVKNETKKKVFEVIHRLNYQYNSAAATLATGKTNTVALITPNNSNPFYSEVAEGIYQEALNKGINVFTYNMPLDQDKDIPFLNQRLVDGILAMDISIHQVEKLRNQVSNLVLIGNDMLDGKTNCVITDNFAGIQLAMNHLVQSGHKKIAFISEPPNYNDIKARIRAYQALMFEHECSKYCEVLIAEGSGIKDGEKMAANLIKSGIKNTAYVVSNDMIAIGLKKSLKATGLQIPADISIIGFDGSWISTVVEPPLTTVKQPMHELGEAGLSLLLDIIKQEHSSPRKIVLNPSFQLGGTTKKLNI